MFKGGYMVENTKDWQDYEKYDRIMRGQPLDKEDLDASQLKGWTK